jgi:hypothetical protein
LGGGRRTKLKKENNPSSIIEEEAASLEPFFEQLWEDPWHQPRNRHFHPNHKIQDCHPV